MNPIKIATISLLTLAIAACGGGGSPTGTPTSDDNGGTTTTDDGTTTSTSTTVGTPDIGSGNGGSYSDAVILIANGGLVDGKLAAGGQVSITVDIVDRDASDARVSGTEYGVVFNSTCAGTEPARASFDNAEAVTTSGTVTTTYRAEGCSGEDILTATLYNSEAGTVDKATKLAIATSVIEVVAPTVNDISYVGATETSLGIKSVGNPDLKQVSTITFVVTDVNGDPIANQAVNFVLSSSSSSASLATDSEITDQSGEVSVVLNAGAKHAVVRVTASTTFVNDSGDSDSVYTNSSPISIATGYPVQSKMTLAASIFNPLSIGEVDTTVSISAFTADRFGNPPPNGTIINFTTEGGKIQSFCETSDGSCSVVWNSQNSIPGMNSADGINVNDIVGFSTILAYTQGDSDYSDVNNNGLFDAGESFIPYTEPFRDDNFNAAQEGNEFYVDTDNNGDHSAADATSYQGSLCSDGALALGHCASNMHIRKSLRLTMSGEAARLRIFTLNGVSYTEVDYLNGASMDATRSHYVVLQDVNENIPANGTSVTFSAEGLEIRSDTGDVENSNGFIVPAITETEPSAVVAGLPERGAAYSISFRDEENTNNPNIPVLKIQVNRVEASTLNYEIGLSNVAAPP